VATSEQIAIFDEFGDLYQESQIWAPKQKRLDALKETIRSWYPDEELHPSRWAYPEGNRFVIQIDPRPFEKSWVSMAKVCKAAGGMRAVLAICDVTFKALAGVVGNSAAEALQIEARTGKRKIKAIQRLIAVEMPKAA